MNANSFQNGWELYQFLPSFVLGFHGCDEAVGEAILRGEKSHLRRSQNDYDWLGKGIYFWESNPQRGLEFAQERRDGGRNSQGVIESPFVLGAVINLGYCLNMCDSSALNEVKRAHEGLRATFEASNLVMPQNSSNRKVRRLDCAVFDFLQGQRESVGLKPYDTIRGTYQEGAPLYEGTAWKHQDHTQICVLNTASILGYFRPIKV